MQREGVGPRGYRHVMSSVVKEGVIGRDGRVVEGVVIQVMIV